MMRHIQKAIIVRQLLSTLLLILLSIPGAKGAGPACPTPQDCTPNPPCGGTATCTYYTLTPNQTTSAMVSEIGFDLSVLRPGGNYCVFEGEGVINANPIMSQIPFTIGPHDIRQLPYNVVLRHTKWERKTKSASGGPCPTP